MSERADWTIKRAAMWVATHNATGDALVGRTREALMRRINEWDLAQQPGTSARRAPGGRSARTTTATLIEIVQAHPVKGVCDGLAHATAEDRLDSGVRHCRPEGAP